MLASMSAGAGGGVDHRLVSIQFMFRRRAHAYVYGAPAAELGPGRLRVSVRMTQWDSGWA